MKIFMNSTIIVIMIFAIVQSIRSGGWFILLGVMTALVLAFDLLALNGEEIIRWLREREFKRQISDGGK